MCKTVRAPRRAAGVAHGAGKRAVAGLWSTVDWYWELQSGWAQYRISFPRGTSNCLIAALSQDAGLVPTQLELCLSPSRSELSLHLACEGNILRNIQLLG